MNDTYPLALGGLSRDVAPDGTQVYWCHDAVQSPELLTAQDDFSMPAIRAGQTLLKRARQRFIFRQETPVPVVVKLFPITSISSKLRHRKYAYREFANMQRAEALGLPIPRSIAFLEKRRFGLVTCSGVVQECLDQSTDLLTLHGEGLAYADAANHTIGVMKQLYEMGVNHIDLRDENIMLNAQTGACHVIDWQYASFVDAQAPWLLEYLAAYFVTLAPQDHRAHLLSVWLPKLHAACEHALAFDKFLTRVEAMIAKRPKVRQRLALKPIDGGSE